MYRQAASFTCIKKLKAENMSPDTKPPYEVVTADMLANKRNVIIYLELRLCPDEYGLCGNFLKVKITFFHVCLKTILSLK